jgi:hypothetical protein
MASMALSVADPQKMPICREERQGPRFSPFGAAIRSSAWPALNTARRVPPTPFAGTPDVSTREDLS